MLAEECHGRPRFVGTLPRLSRRRTPIRLLDPDITLTPYQNHTRAIGSHQISRQFFRALLPEKRERGGVATIHQLFRRIQIGRRGIGNVQNHQTLRHYVFLLLFFSPSPIDNEGRIVLQKVLNFKTYYTKKKTTQAYA